MAGRADEELLNEEVPVEGEEVITDEVGPEAPPAEEEPVPAGNLMTHTVDEVPELSGKSIGDIVTFRIAEVSDDGNSYGLEVVEEAPLAPEEPGVRGADVVKEALL